MTLTTDAETGSGAADRRMTDEQLAHWMEHGYVIIPNFLTADEVAAARENIAYYLPTWEEYAASPERYRSLIPSHGIVHHELPFAGNGALNDISVHPAILDFVGRALGTDRLLLLQSIVWGKYAGVADYDQEHHCDLGNNSLVVPRDEGEFRQVPMIICYSDNTIERGATRVLSQQLTRDRDFVYPAAIRRAQEPEIYEQEVAFEAPAGSLLVYSMSTFHRGAAFTAKEGHRFSHHIVYRAAGKEWMGWRSWPRHANEQPMADFIERISVRQRSALGFPEPGHEYWTEDTLARVAVRYPNLDLAPYRDALR